MDRRRPYLLMSLSAALLLAAAVSLTACGQELPVRFAIEDRFDDREIGIILQAAEDWNRITREWLGFDGLVFSGRFTDKDGFYPYDDLNRDLDGPKRVYRLEPGAWLDLMNDIHAVKDANATYWVVAYNIDPAILMWPSACEAKFIADRGSCLAAAMRHEFGHTLGLAHLPPGMTGMMSPAAEVNKWPQIATDDIRALCTVHSCLKQP